MKHKARESEQTSVRLLELSRRLEQANVNAQTIPPYFEREIVNTFAREWAVSEKTIKKYLHRLARENCTFAKLAEFGK